MLYFLNSSWLIATYLIKKSAVACFYSTCRGIQLSHLYQCFSPVSHVCLDLFSLWICDHMGHMQMTSKYLNCAQLTSVTSNCSSLSIFHVFVFATKLVKISHPMYCFLCWQSTRNLLTSWLSVGGVILVGAGRTSSVVLCLWAQPTITLLACIKADEISVFFSLVRIMFTTWIYHQLLIH